MQSKVLCILLVKLIGCIHCVLLIIALGFLNLNSFCPLALGALNATIGKYSFIALKASTFGHARCSLSSRRDENYVLLL